MSLYAFDWREFLNKRQRTRRGDVLIYLHKRKIRVRNADQLEQ